MKQALAEALEARGYTTLTEVQTAVTDPALTGKDLLVSAQTGSGKTLGFGLAIAPRLFGEAEVFEEAAAPLALIIAPTRELALQVKRELAWLFEKAGAVLASTVGGMDMRDERRALERGAHIVVATPGRLRDHIMRGSIDLSAIRAVVLDEADEMLDLGFREDLEFILEQAPEDRQTLLFSATVPAAIARLAQNYQRDAVRVAATSGTSQHADIDYRALTVAAQDVENAIINVLRFHEAPNAIVFCNTRAVVNRLTTRLSNRGFSVVALSGELSQSERSHALQAMRDGRARVCVATDVAARGIDLPNLELVIHAELPTNQETLLHRSGRTGRAGRKGVSTLIVPPAARKKAERLLGWAKLTAEWAEAPSADDVTARDDERMLANPDWTAEVEPSSVSIVGRLAETFSAEQLAAAYVRLYRERHSAPEELSDVNAAPPPKPRVEFGPSVWFSVSGGRAAGAEPRRLLPMICKLGGLTREDIGAIRIQPNASLVEISAASVPGFLKAIGPGMELEAGAVLSQLDAKPEFDRAPRRERPEGPRERKPRREETAPVREEPVAAPAPADDVPPAPAPAPVPAEPRAEKPRAPKPYAERPPRPQPLTPEDRGPRREGFKPKRDGAPKGDRSKRDWTPDGERPKRDGKPGFRPKWQGSRGDGEGERTEPLRAEPWKPRKPKAAGEGNDAPRRGPKPSFGKPKGRPSNDGSDAPKRGPKPPVGKPTSKKNKARAAANAADPSASLRKPGAGRGGKPGGFKPGGGKPGKGRGPA